MEKSGDWIAAFGSELEVSRLSVEPAPGLGVVRISVSKPDLSQLLAVYHLDRLEGGQLKRELDLGLLDLARAEPEEVTDRHAATLTTLPEPIVTLSLGGGFADEAIAALHVAAGDARGRGIHDNARILDRLEAYLRMEANKA